MRGVIRSVNLIFGSSRPSPISTPCRNSAIVPSIVLSEYDASLNSLAVFLSLVRCTKFLFTDLTVLEDRALGSEGKHHKLTVEQEGITREVLLFNTKHHHPLKYLKSLICTLDINLWRDKQSLQLIASYVET